MKISLNFPLALFLVIAVLNASLIAAHNQEGTNTLLDQQEKVEETLAVPVVAGGLRGFNEAGDSNFGSSTPNQANDHETFDDTHRRLTEP